MLLQIWVHNVVIIEAPAVSMLRVMRKASLVESVVRVLITL